MLFIMFARIGAFFASAIMVGAAAMPSASHSTLARRGSSPLPSDEGFQSTVLSYINDMRSKHRASPLSWDSKIANTALQKANGCRIDHSGPYGENAYTFWQKPVPASTDWNTKTRNAIDSWFKEKDLYNSGRTTQALHFTQLVWKGTSKIGCAWNSRTCQGNWFYCDFDPRGNVGGRYTENVTG